MQKLKRERVNRIIAKLDKEWGKANCRPDIQELRWKLEALRDAFANFLLDSLEIKEGENESKPKI